MRVLALAIVLAACASSSKLAPAPSHEISNTAPAAAAPPPEPAATAALRVLAIEPETGDEQGGTYVRIRGNGFAADGPRNVKVYFGSRQGTVIRFASDTELIVEAPGGKTNETVDVLCIFEPGGVQKLSNAFTFVAKGP